MRTVSLYCAVKSNFIINKDSVKWHYVSVLKMIIFAINSVEKNNFINYVSHLQVCLF